MKKVTIEPFKKIIITFTLGLFVLATAPLPAQISFDDDVDDEVPGAPIDGLIALGIAAGALYGIKKLKSKK